MTDDLNPTDWVTTKEAAELTGYTAAYFRRLIARGRLDTRKIGRDWVCDKSKVLENAEEMKRPGPANLDPWRTGGATDRHGVERPGGSRAAEVPAAGLLVIPRTPRACWFPPCRYLERWWEFGSSQAR